MNKYLKKIASIPVETIDVDDIPSESLEKLFKIFKMLPGDSPEGEPSQVTKYVRSKLRE